MIEIIPAIDLIDGECVRLTQGDFSQSTMYSDEPLQVAKLFETVGFKRLHVIDLDGARNGRLTNLKSLEKIATGTNLTIDFGGGIKTAEDLRSVFDAGASIATIGSLAVKDPLRFASFVEYYGSERILLGADVRDSHLSIDGWLTVTQLEIVDFLQERIIGGIREVFVTDISKDGLLNGPAFELYKRILETLPDLNLIASGGVGSISDVYELEKVGCRGVIIGKALYEGTITFEELAKYNGNVSKANNTLS